jgi:hypothetical protein
VIPLLTTFLISTLTEKFFSRRLEHLKIPKDLLVNHQPASDFSREELDKQITHFGDPKNSSVGSQPVQVLPKSRLSRMSRSELGENPYTSFGITTKLRKASRLLRDL